MIGGITVGDPRAAKEKRLRLLSGQDDRDDPDGRSPDNPVQSEFST